MVKTCIKCGKKQTIEGPNKDSVKNLYLVCSACLPLHKDDEFRYAEEAEKEIAR